MVALRSGPSPFSAMDLLRVVSFCRVVKPSTTVPSLARSRLLELLLGPPATPGASG
jgi:hypothetical protein